MLFLQIFESLPGKRSENYLFSAYIITLCSNNTTGVTHLKVSISYFIL